MSTLDKIVSLLATQKKTQKQLTDYLGVQKGVFTKWKSGENTSYIKHVPKIATFLGVSTDYLLGTEQKNKSLSEKDKLLNDIRDILDSKSIDEIIKVKNVIKEIMK